MNRDVATIRTTILEVVRQTLLQAGRSAPESLSECMLLADQLRIDSLDFAVIVVELECQLGVDPFRTRRAAVRTLGDLVQVYKSFITEDEKRTCLENADLEPIRKPQSAIEKSQ
jgi:acyl carrier protein